MPTNGLSNRARIAFLALSASFLPPSKLPRSLSADDARADPPNPTDARQIGVGVVQEPGSFVPAPPNPRPQGQDFPATASTISDYQTVASWFNSEAKPSKLEITSQGSFRIASGVQADQILEFRGGQISGIFRMNIQGAAKHGCLLRAISGEGGEATVIEVSNAKGVAQYYLDASSNQLPGVKVVPQEVAGSNGKPSIKLAYQDCLITYLIAFLRDQGVRVSCDSLEQATESGAARAARKVNALHLSSDLSELTLYSGGALKDQSGTLTFPSFVRDEKAVTFKPGQAGYEQALRLAEHNCLVVNQAGRLIIGKWQLQELGRSPATWALRSIGAFDNGRIVQLTEDEREPLDAWGVIAGIDFEQQPTLIVDQILKLLAEPNPEARALAK